MSTRFVPEPMQIRAILKGEVVEVRILIKHPMHSNLVWHADTRVNPAHFIKTIQGSCNGRPVLYMHMSFSVSRDPYFSFSFKGGKRGDNIVITWLDTEELTRTDATVVI